MSAYPDLGDFFEAFADHYMQRTATGSVLMVKEEELQTLSCFLVTGIVDWVDSEPLSVEGDRIAIGEFLDGFFVNKYPPGGDGWTAFKITDEEMCGLGLFLARAFVGWILKLDRDRDGFSGFSDIIKRQRLGVHAPLRQRLIAGAMQ